MSAPNIALRIFKLFYMRDPKYGRFSKLPGAARLIERLLFDGDHMVALPRDAVVRINQEIEGPEQFVLPSQLVDYFIDRSKYHWIMNFCICRRSNPCKDYPIELGCLFMGEPVMDINPRWGRRVDKAEAKAHIRRCQDAGLIHFIGRSKLDTVWLGLGPKAGHKLLTVCNCCPCCCITRPAAYMDRRLSDKLKRAPGVSVTVTDDCIGCGRCVQEGCFIHALHMKNGRAVIDEDCRGCGRCVERCPQGAIRMAVEPERFMQATIDQITGVIDIPPAAPS